jgi:uncharacterized protein
LLPCPAGSLLIPTDANVQRYRLLSEPGGGEGFVLVEEEADSDELAFDSDRTEDRRMSARKGIVEKYIEGFRRGDHAQILSTLTDDVVWELHGYKTLQGKDAFDAEIENDAFVGRPTLTIDRLVEEGNSVVAVGSGTVARQGGGGLEFVFCDVFTFTGDAISRLETYQVNLG